MRTNPLYDSLLFLIGQMPDHDALEWATALCHSSRAVWQRLDDRPVGLSTAGRTQGVNAECA